MNYYKVDLIDRDGGTSGSTYCIKCQQKLTDDEVTEAATSLELIDKNDLEEYDLNVEDITDDGSELEQFMDIAELYVKQSDGE